MEQKKYWQSFGELNRSKAYEVAANDEFREELPFEADDKGFLKAEIADDGLHPNAKGYEIMKPLAEEAIKTALKKKQKSGK